MTNAKQICLVYVDVGKFIQFAMQVINVGTPPAREGMSLSLVETEPNTLVEVETLSH